MGPMYNKSYLYPVINKNKYKTASDMYFACKTNDKYYLFTESDLKKAYDRANSNPEDLLDESLFYNENHLYNNGFRMGILVGSLIITSVVTFSWFFV